MPETIASLLNHPALWRGRQTAAAGVETLGTGFASLDAALPGGGWPRTGLVEILTPHHGLGELRLLVPLLASLARREPVRWTAWITPPFEPYAPALAARGLAIERQLVVRAKTELWALEQALGSGACDVALAWTGRTPPVRSLRRLQLATERGRTLGFLFRPSRAARQSSPATLRMTLAPLPNGAGVSLELLKSRGGARGVIEVRWAGAACSHTT
jgi:cell division inhibitor SulA/protein ImuA